MNYYSKLKLFLALILVMLVPANIWALPSGGSVAAGSATINQSGSTLGVSQLTNKAIINWNSFSIGSGESVNFSQPSALSIALNRVIGIDPSLLNGTLSANGRVFLLNPNGILIGSGASINVSGLLASTMNISDQDFLNDNYNFNQASTIGSVINNGTITGNEVVLAAPTIENNGLISANLGKVFLASGDSLVLNFTGNDLIGFNVTGSNVADRITNSGTITADGGEVYISAALAQGAVKSVVNNTGVIEANSISNVGGVIRLSGDTVTNSGTISATGTTGGYVELTGQRVGLFDGVVDVSGTNGGGTALIGGDYHGDNPDVFNATAVYVAPQAVINADATINGDGGKIIVWSNEVSRVYGTLTARGGSEGGNGGFIETSSHGYLDVNGMKVDANALNGTKGTLLLDPASITIDGTLFDGVLANLGDGIWAAGEAGSFIDIATLKAMFGASVTLEATNDILWAAGQTLDYNGLGAVSLTLKAGNAITFNGTITDTVAGGDSMNVTFNADSDASGAGNIMITGGIINSSGGNITLGGGANPALNPAVGIGTATFAEKSGMYIAGAALLDAGAGNITLTGVGIDGTSAAYGVLVYQGSQIKTTSGTITLNGTGGIGVDYNSGIVVSGTIVSSVDGAIVMTGFGGGDGTGSYNGGVVVSQGAVVESTGLATIDLLGTGGNGVDWNAGVGVGGSDSRISSVNGNITITGTGGGSGIMNQGVYIGNTATVYTSGAASINITGNGSVTGTSGNYGVFIDGGPPSAVYSTISGSGAIIINGTGGGNGTGVYNAGVGISNGSGELVYSLGSSPIFITGIGGNGTDWNVGVFLNDSIVSSVTGAITITGTGNGTGANNRGVYMVSGADIISTGTATIDIIGTGGSGTNDNRGVYISDTGTQVTSVDGTISINGTGGNGTGVFNGGVFVGYGAVVESTGLATIDLNGTSGNGTDLNVGVVLSDSVVSSVTGAITINGTGNGTGANNYGVYMLSSVLPGAHILSTGSATIDIVGIGVGASAGIITGSGVTIGGASATGSITLTADNTTGSDSIDLTGATIQSAGNLYLQPLVASTAIGIVGGAGEFNLSTTDLNAVQNGFTNIYIGSVNSTGLLTLGDGAGAGYSFKDNLTLRTPAGAGSIVIDDPLATGSLTQVGTITLQAGNSITVNSSIMSQGQAITLNSDRDASGAGNIVMNVGSSILSNGGNITLGGGANPALTAAVGVSNLTPTTKTGVYLDGAALNAGAGNISIRGTGVAGTTGGYGVYALNGTTIQSTTGAITIKANGGSGTHFNYGLFLKGAGTAVSTIGGSIMLDGAGTGTGINNYGVHVSGAVVQSGGNGTITINGVGGAGTYYNWGVVLADPGTSVTSLDGDITINGTGGSAGMNGWSYGTYMTSGVNVSSTGAAAINIIGIGGAGVDSNYGVYLDGTTTVITSISGAISIRGGSNGTGLNNYGVLMEVGADITSTGTATIDIIGIGAGTAAGIYATSGHMIGGALASGNITLTADTVSGTDSIVLTGATIKSTGNLVLQPWNGTYGDAAAIIGVAGGAGEFNLSTADLNVIQDGFAKIYIGSADGAGAMTVNAYTFLDNLTLRNPGAGSGGIVINDVLSVGPNNMTLNTTGAVTQIAAVNAAGLELLGTGGTYTLTNTGNSITTLAGNTGSVSYSQPGALTIGTVNTVGLTASASILVVLTDVTADITLGNTVTANGPNDALVLVSGRNFINNAGATPLNAPNGRFIVYSTSPVSNALGAFTSPSDYFDCTYGLCVPPVLLGSAMAYSGSQVTVVTAPRSTLNLYALEVLPYHNRKIEGGLYFAGEGGREDSGKKDLFRFIDDAKDKEDYAGECRILKKTTGQKYEDARCSAL